MVVNSEIGKVASLYSENIFFAYLHLSRREREFISGKFFKRKRIKVLKGEWALAVEDRGNLNFPSGFLEPEEILEIERGLFRYRGRNYGIQWIKEPLASFIHFEFFAQD